MEIELKEGMFVSCLRSHNPSIKWNGLSDKDYYQIVRVTQKSINSVVYVRDDNGETISINKCYCTPVEPLLQLALESEYENQ
jgi:hypothetical protein